MSKPFASLLLCLGLLALSACGGMPASRDAGQDPAAARFDEAVALMRGERYSQAVAILEPMSQSRPELPGVHVNLGIAYDRLERGEDAAKAWQAALNADPNHAAALNLMAIHHREQGRFEEARALYRRLLRTDPRHANGHLNLAILCDLYLQDLSCALSHYQHFQALADTEHEQVAFWIADLQRRLPEASR